MLFRVLLLLVLAGPAFAKVCPEVRTRDLSISELRGCSVIAGNVEIATIEEVPVDYYSELAFPELREIRGYLMMYRVYHIITLGLLFPNLMIIRGINTFQNYSLILYDLKDLVEINLPSLQYIVNGNTRIEGCKKLCYLNTINWTAIGGPSHNVTLIDNNEFPCPRCPAKCHGNCWHNGQCQVVAVNNSCHPECIGCTEPNNPRKCLACRHFENDGICVDSCPKDKFRNRLLVSCLTLAECVNNTLNEIYWAHNDECVNACPENYKKAELNGTSYCEFCGENCTNICEGVKITDWITPDILEGCVYMEGSLLVHITSEFLADQLYDSLRTIREIRDHVMIIRSPPITNLGFLKNLQVIHGRKLHRNRSALVVYDNVNLYDVGNLSLQIKNGTIGFYDNPKLCLNKIDEFAGKLGLNYSEEYDVFSNGDDKVCNIIEMNITVTNITESNVTLTWENVSRQNQSIYLVSYIQDQFGNMTIDTNSAMCCEDSWSTILVTNTTVDLWNLNFFTQYAYYITTYSNSSGRTEIKHFSTSSGEPSEILDFKANATSTDSVTLMWQEPAFPNGILGQYEIVAYSQPDDEDFLTQRDFCKNPQQQKSMNSTLCCKKKIPAERTFAFCKNPVLMKLALVDCLFPREVTVKTPIFPFLSKKRLRYLRSLGHLDRKEFKIEEPNATSYVVKSLSHFTLYVFLIIVCNVDNDEQCSPRMMVSERTRPKEGADDIPSKPSASVENSKATLKWHEPLNPNAFIVSYHIEYQKNSSSIFDVICITRDQFVVSHHQYQLELPPGLYSVRIRASSLAGPGNFTEKVYFEILAAKNFTSVVLIIGLVMTSALLITGIGHYSWNYLRTKRSSKQSLIEEEEEEYHSCPDPIYVEDEWEVHREDVEIFKKITQGSFVTVCTGIIKSRNQPCAVKMLRSSSPYEKVKFLNDTSSLKWLSDAHHVVKLLGVVSRGQQVLTLLELLPKGELKAFLRHLRLMSTPLSSKEMHRMAAEIADGMMYLSSQKFVHKDLAARNCMVSGDLTVKIGDLGMSKEFYRTDYFENNAGKLLPIRWMAPESLNHELFTRDSDLWSYGVLLWELATFADLPYQDIGNEQVIHFVLARNTLSKPPNCPDLLYDLMQSCWKWRPDQRITFREIVKQLEGFVPQHFRLCSFYHSCKGGKLRRESHVRVYNAAALTVPFNQNTAVQWNVDDDTILL